MGARSLTAVENRGRNEARIAARSAVLSYQLNVIAADAADVVQSVGGWLFDHSTAGWKVNVLLPNLDDHTDARSLRILGVGTLELQSTLASVDSDTERAAGLAIAADLLETDERVDAHLDDVLRCSDTEVALWGDGRSRELVDCVQYGISAAAMKFKAHALAAAGLADVPVSAVEIFSAATTTRWIRT